MAHLWAQDGEDESNAKFRCVHCATSLWFNKPGVGEPAAVPLDAGGWAPPENPDQWCGKECA